MDIWIKQHEEINAECVAYADDSVSFSEEEIMLKAPEDTGIIINEEKSGYVKFNGEWIKPLKFLGLEFDGKILRANTRKGSTLSIGNWTKVLLNIDSYISKLGSASELYTVEDVLKWIEDRQDQLTDEKGYFSKTSWEEFFKSRLIGFVQSRLYQGNWNLDNLHQDFQMSFVNGSWMDTKLRKEKLDIFIASSYASRSLENIFRWNQKLRRLRRDSLDLSQINREKEMILQKRSRRNRRFKDLKWIKLQK
jgi:hypothetical protein